MTCIVFFEWPKGKFKFKITSKLQGKQQHRLAKTFQTLDIEDDKTFFSEKAFELCDESSGISGVAIKV